MIHIDTESRCFVCSRCLRIFSSSSELMEISKKEALCSDCYLSLLFPGVREFSFEAFPNSLDSRVFENDDPNLSV